MRGDDLIVDFLKTLRVNPLVAMCRVALPHYGFGCRHWLGAQLFGWHRRSARTTAEAGLLRALVPRCGPCGSRLNCGPVFVRQKQSPVLAPPRPMPKLTPGGLSPLLMLKGPLPDNGLMSCVRWVTGAREGPVGPVGVGLAAATPNGDPTTPLQGFAGTHDLTQSPLHAHWE